MKDRRKREWLRSSSTSSSSTWRCTFFVFFVSCALVSTLTFSTFSLFGVSFRPAKLVYTWQNPTMSAVTIAGDFAGDNDGDPYFSLTSQSPRLSIDSAISLPDHLIVFLNSIVVTSPTAIKNLHCLYYPPASLHPNLHLPIISSTLNLLRCPSAPRGFSISISGAATAVVPHTWSRLAYAALLDADNTTVVFAKGLNLRPARLSDPSRFSCIFGFGNFSNHKYLLPSPAISAAQEVFRCPTPRSVLLRLRSSGDSPSPLVSVAVSGRRGFSLPSVARPEPLRTPNPKPKKPFTMCVCTMVRNQARFLREWIAYHSRIGVQRWFIYDNNSDDGIEDLVAAMDFDVKVRAWPWVKTQEAGFAHCAVASSSSCEWVGFIDVDEFIYLPGNLTLHEILQNYSSSPTIGELRTTCHTFGPSGRSAPPPEGVVLGYTCRMGSPERHKSIVRPESLNPSLINIVHHFHLKEGRRYVNLDRGMMVINHYKYQAWEVFKEKFFRRVATYVADWQDEENVGSKDRAPGLGTRPVEPPDWTTRFCEVNDTGLRDWVLRDHAGLLPR